MKTFTYLNLLTLVFLTIGIDYVQGGILKGKPAESHFSYQDPDDPNFKTQVGTAKAIVYISNYHFGELQSTAASKVFMSTADKGYNNLSFLGRGTVVGSADRNREPPAAAKYYQPPQNKVFYSPTGISYGGATEHTVVCSTELFRPKKIKNLEITARGNASLDIDTWDSPSERADDLDPSARANAEELNPGQHFDPAGGTSVDTDNYQWVFSSIANLDTGSTTDYVVIESATTDNTPDCDSCTDRCSSCPITYACGVHSGPPSDASSHVAASCGISGHYVCDGSDHSLQASCTSTDSNGNSCTVTGFYACQTHTCQYPEPESEDTSTTCANGHSYDPNNPSEANAHRTRTCRYSRCGNSWPDCSNNPLCNDPRRNALGKYCWPE